MAVTVLKTSWLGYESETGKLVFWDGAKYRPLEEAAGYATVAALAAYLLKVGGSISGNLGVGGATADDTNRLAVLAAAILFNAEDDDIRVKLNKLAAGDTATFLYQTAFSGRAEIGLAGDDDFHFKVSPDGSTWIDAIRIDKDTGAVLLTWKTVAEMPSAAGLDGYVMGVWNGDAGNKCLAVSDGTNWRRIALGAAISAT